MLNTKYYLFFLCYLLPFVLFVPTYVVAQVAQPYYFEPITANNDLPHQTIYRVLQDKKGFMWFGTRRGLIRYDGYTYRLFGQTQTKTVGFLGKAIHALMEDKAGNLWLGTHSGDLCKRDAKTGTFDYLSNASPFNILFGKRIQSFFEDHQGQIWIGTLDDGLFIYTPKTNRLVHFYSGNSRLSNNAVFSFAEDKTGRIWVGTAGEGINYFDPKTNTFQQRYADPPNMNGYQKTLLLDAQDNLWIGTQGTGLYQLNLTTNVMRHFGQTNTPTLTSNAVMSLAINTSTNQQTDELLVATDGGGLDVLNRQTNTFTAYKSDHRIAGSLNTNALYDICIDHDNNVWLGTFNGGVNLHKAHQVRFEHFSYTGHQANELSNRSVLGLCQTRDGTIFVGTDGGGLNIFDKKNKRFSVINNPTAVQTNVVKTIYEDAQRRLWLGYFNGGLALYDRPKNTFRHYLSSPSDTASLSNNSVWAIAADNQGLLWVGTVGNGVNVFDPKTGKSKRFYNTPDPTSLSNNGIMAILIDSKNRIWIGTENGGVNLFNPQKNNFTRLQQQPNHPKSISSNAVRSIFEDSRGRIWVGTENGGINLWLGTDQFKHYTTKNGLLSDAVMGIAEDAHGYLWLSMYEGIARLDSDKDSLQQFKFNGSSTLLHRGRENQFNQAAILRTADGDILVGGIHGLHVVNTETVSPNLLKPQVVLTDFSILDASMSNGRLGTRTIFEGDINDTKQVHLSYKDNVFALEFAALDFTEPQYNQYAFKMEGFDAHWSINSAEQRRVTYTNLNAGTYTFRVRGSNSSGEWSDKETAVSIVIAPPFWETVWFRLLVFLSAIGASIWGFRIYIQRREMQLQQRVLESDREILSLKNKQLEVEQNFLTLQNDKLETEVATKNNELMSKAAQMAHKNELLSGIKTNLESIKTADEIERGQSLRGLTRTLASEIQSNESWEQFLFYFNQVNQTFMHDLQSKHPNLTQNDLRMCALARLNMSNREIAALLNISIKGVEKSRYRLKKRLDLSAEEDLARYLTAF